MSCGVLKAVHPIHMVAIHPAEAVDSYDKQPTGAANSSALGAGNFRAPRPVGVTREHSCSDYRFRQRHASCVRYERIE